MKSKDLFLVANLRKNARSSLVDLSKQTKIPVSTIYEKLKSNFNDVVLNYTALLNFPKLGFNVQSLVFFKVNRDKKLQIGDFLKKHHFVNTLYRINNGFDFIVELFTPKVSDLDIFLNEINDKFDVLDVKIYYISETLTRENMLSEPIYVKLLNQLIKE